MDHLLCVLIGLFLGASIGMVSMGLLAAADRENHPEPAPEQPRTGRASSPEGSDPSLVGIGVGHIAGSATRARDSV